MVYKRLLTSIIIRIILLTVTLGAIVYFWMGNRDFLILLNLAAVLVLQVYLFIRSQNQVNRKLRTFFEAFRFDDLGLTLSKEFSDRSFRDLYSSMQYILKHVKQINLENRQQKQYFQSVTEHAGVGILAYNERKEVTLVNRTLKDLLGFTELTVMNDLNTIRDNLSALLIEIKPGGNELVRLTVQDQADIIGERHLHLAVRCAEIKIGKETIHILTFQNIKSELEENELESWQKVIRVLTHEITNSTGPISSAAQTMQDILKHDESAGNDSQGLVPPLKEDLLEGLKIIQERSMGMEKFAEQFRKVTLMPKPIMDEIIVEELLQGISVLFDKRMEKKRIEFGWHIENHGMKFYADRKLVDQALINLMNNAIEALKDSTDKKINLVARTLPGRQCVIIISDTGKGIPEEDIDKIFIPFYTSREGGSGIGLPLVRNIMRMHRGSLQVSSEPGVKTTFSMIF